MENGLKEISADNYDTPFPDEYLILSLFSVSLLALLRFKGQEARQVMSMCMLIAMEKILQM